MKKKIAIFLCAACLASLTACGEKEAGPTVEAIAESEQEPQSEDSLNSGNEEEKESIKDAGGSDASTLQETEEAEENLEGNVKSINNEGVILSKTFTYEMDDGSGLIAVSGEDGSGNEVLIAVNFSENTKYELYTVKNSGVNGDSDVTKQEASFSDIKEGASLSLNGHYVIEDEEFTADHVVIYKFV